MPEEKSKKDKFDESKRELAEKNSEIKKFFKNLRESVSTKVGNATKEMHAYIKALETVMVYSPVVGAEMVKRQLNKAKENVDARVEKFAKEASKSDKKLDVAQSRRGKEAEKQEKHNSKYTKSASAARKIDDKLTSNIKKTHIILLKAPKGTAKLLAALGFEKTAASLYNRATDYAAKRVKGVEEEDLTLRAFAKRIDNYFSAVGKSRMELDKKASKSKDAIDKSSDTKEKAVKRYSDSKRNKGTKGAKVYSSVEKSERKAKAALYKTTISGVRKLGKGISFFEPDSKIAEKAIDRLEKAAKKSMKEKSVADKTVKKAVDRVHSIKDGIETTKSTVKRDKERLSKLKEKQASEIKAGKHSLEGTGKFSRKVTNGVRLASLSARTTLGKGKITINGVKAGVDRLFNKKVVARDTQSKTYSEAKRSVESHSKTADRMDKVNRNITNTAQFVIGGAVYSTLETGKRVINGAKTIKTKAQEKGNEIKEGVRAAKNYIASAPDRVEMASRRGISNMLEGLANNTKKLADKVNPKTPTKESDRTISPGIEPGRA